MLIKLIVRLRHALMTYPQQSYDVSVHVYTYTKCSMYRAYVGVISRCIVSNDIRSVMCTGSRLALLLKHADRTLQHKPPSTTEGQRVAWMNVGLLLKSGAIRSILDTDGQKAEAIDVDGYLEEKTAHAI